MFRRAVDPENILSSFGANSTTSRELFEAIVRGPYSVSHFDFPERTMPFKATNSRVHLGSTTLHHAHYEAPVRMKFAARPCIRQPIVLTGCSSVKDNRSRYINNFNNSVIFPPDAECTVECMSGYAHLLIEYDMDKLRKFSLDFSDYTPFSNKFVAPIVASDADKLARLGSIAAVFAFNLTGYAVLKSPAIVELEQAMICAFLIENGLVNSIEATRPAGTWAASAMRDYIHANWKQPLTVEDIAKTCNVSARSVFVIFKKVFGSSPMVYLRNVRLDESRRLLREMHDEASVMRIALECGFSHGGHFAKRYEERFGELPSETIRKFGHVDSLRKSSSS